MHMLIVPSLKSNLIPPLGVNEEKGLFIMSSREDTIRAH